MALATFYGTIIHIILFIIAGLCADFFSHNVSIITEITETVFRDKLIASLSICVGISLLGYWCWNLVGRFMYINDILNSRYKMVRNWYILFCILIFIQAIVYFFLSRHYSIGNMFGIFTTTLFFLAPVLCFLSASAVASPLLFKYTSPGARKVRPAFSLLYGSSRLRSK